MYRRIGQGAGQMKAGGSPLGFLRNVFFPKKPNQKPVDDPVALMNRKRLKLAVAGVSLAVFATFFVLAPAMAADGYVEQFINLVLGMLTSFVLVLCEILGFLILILVDFLVSITQYNNFVRAYPVRIGWPIMRDTVNMFFIIVVLVSAFSTIVGYKDFHYKSVLPKLLLMAVLINFSKTLIGLMVDFSQVIVLTFVNGFKQVAGNNFIQALHLGEVMKLNNGSDQVVQEEGGKVSISWSGTEDVTALTMVSIFAAAVFALWILSLAMTMLVIMIIFFLARIIVIWMLLITSPVMFFAWALPGKMQKAFSAFTSDWWKRLSSALVGGPVMAFFLWLALAMAQDKSAVSEMYKPSQSSEMTQQSGIGKNTVITKIGSAENLSHFVVMIAFMLMGVQTAVSMARDAAPQLGGLADKVAGAGGMLGAGAALGAITARYGAAGAGKAAMAVERQTGVGAKLAGKLATSGMPMTMGMRTALAKASTFHKREAAKKEGEFKESIGMMAPADQMMMLNKVKGSTFATQAEILAANKMQTKLVTGVPFQKERTKATRDALGVTPGVEEPEKDAAARHTVNNEIAAHLAELEKVAIDNSDNDLLKEINEAREKNPAHFSGVGKKAEIAAKLASDPQAMNKIQDDAFQDAAFALNFMKGKGWVDNNGELNVGVENDADYKSFMRGRQGNLAKGHLEFARQSPDNRARANRLLTGTATDADNYTIQVAKNGERWAASAGAGTLAQGRFDRTTNDAAVVLRNAAPGDAAVIRSNVGSLGQVRQADGSMAAIGVGDIGRELPVDVARDFSADLSALGGRPPTPTQRAAMGAKYAAHVTSRAIFGLDTKTGTFQSPTSEAAHGQMLTGLRSTVQAEMSAGNLNAQTVSAFSSAVSQAGTQGPAFAQVANMVEGMDRAAILNVMQAGTGEENKKMQTAFMNVISRARKDDESGLRGTDFQRAREQLIKVDTTSDENRKISEKLRSKLVSSA